MGDLENALPLQSKVVEKDKDTPIFQYHLGMMYFKKGEVEKARELLAKAVQSKSDYAGLQEAREVLKTLQPAK